MITLRAVATDDLEIFFTHQLDTEATRMAAFTSADPSDRAAFLAKWQRILGDDAILVRTIVVDEQVAGHVVCYEREGEPEVSYWLGREYWGRGIATEALFSFMQVESRRPLHARAAADNIGSRRVLERCGFVITGHERGFANARGEEIDEVVMTLVTESDMEQTHIILFVADQRRSVAFYRTVLDVEPRLDVPNMTEFALPGGAVLGLMPHAAIDRLLGDAVPGIGSAGGVARSELYLVVEVPELYQRRAIGAGGRELSPLMARSWGHRAGYTLDLDGHVLAFAEPVAKRTEPR